MTAKTQKIMEQIYGDDIYRNFSPPFPEDLQGWNSDHPTFRRIVMASQPNLILDVGVWKGRSTIFLANLLRESNLDGTVIAIDTFLGNAEHWNKDRDIYKSMRFRHGMPFLYWQFLSNIKHRSCEDYVVPLAQTSENAAKILHNFGIRANLIHIDAAHEYGAVLRDAHLYWDLLEPGGCLVGDDFHDTWPGVVQAATEFARFVDQPLGVEEPKWIISKPMP